MKNRKLFCIIICFVLLINNLPAMASSVQTVDPASNGAAIIVNNVQMETVLKVNEIPYVHLRSAIDALGREVVYDDRYKLTYIDVAGYNRQLEYDDTLYGYLDNSSIIDPHEFFEFSQAYWGPMVVLDDEDRIHEYISLAREQGLKIARHTKISGSFQYEFYLNYQGVKTEASDIIVHSYRYDIGDSMTDGLPNLEVQLNKEEMKQPTLHTLDNGETYREIRQFVVDGNYNYSAALIYQDSVYVPLSFLVYDMAEAYVFNPDTKTSFVGGAAEDMDFVINYTLLEFEGRSGITTLPSLSHFQEDARA